MPKSRPSYTVSFIVAVLVQEWRAAGVEQLRLSTVDLTGVPSMENLHRGVKFALQHKEQGTSVYVHCKAGRSRSATLAAAYLIRVSMMHSDCHLLFELQTAQKPSGEKNIPLFKIKHKGRIKNKEINNK